MLDVTTAAPAGTNVLPLLSRACQFFPESARLAAEHGSALHRAGRAKESYAEHARALSLHRQSNITRDEFKQGEAPPLIWQLAEHIRATGGR